MKTKIHARVQRLEAIVRPLEEERLKRWLRSLSDAELMRYANRGGLKSRTTKENLNVDLKTLSNEQLIRLHNGEPLSSVLDQERKPA
jgi:hypothetical protein